VFLLLVNNQIHVLSYLDDNFSMILIPKQLILLATEKIQTELSAEPAKSYMYDM